MKIESLIKRAGGSFVEMDAPSRTYHFAPTDSDTRHIADVEEQVHARALLRIKEGYAAVDGESFDDGVDAPQDERTLKGSAVHSAAYEIVGGDSIPLQDLVNMAFDDSGLSESEWNMLDDQERYDYIDTTLAELQGKNPQDVAEIIESAGEPVNADEAQANVNRNTPVVDVKEQAYTAQEVADAAKATDINQNGIADNLEAMTGKELIPIYEAKFGRKPSSKMRVEDIKRALSEDDD